MTEVFFAVRDGVGLNSRIILEGEKILIKDLPPQAYDLFHGGRRIAQNLGPNQIPGYLLHYCANLEKEGFEFMGKFVYERISNLEITARSPEQTN